MADALQPVAAILFVLGLLILTLYLLRRRGVASFRNTLPGKARQLAVMERLPLGSQHALHLVRFGDRQFLVATAPGSCQIVESTEKEAGVR